MITLKEISYLEFDGEFCKGTIGQKKDQYVFTHMLGKLNDRLVTSYEHVAAAVQRLTVHSMSRNNGPLTIFDGFIKVPADKADGLAKELNTLVSSWHKK